MPNLNTIRAGISELPKGPPLVVAIAGGTTGIGSYVARAFATTFKNHGSRLRVYIIGRNAERAETVLRFGRETSPGSDWRFVHASDASLISDVDNVCHEITRQEAEAPFAGGPSRLDVLYMSQALSPMQESPTTEEGLDSQMSLLYYSRMRFIQNLSPLLTAAPNTAHAISIFAGSMEDSVKPGEMPIGVPSTETYGITAVRKHSVFMKTLFFEELAEKNAGQISFIHIYPGLVDGPVFYSDVNPLWFRILWRVLKPLVSWYVTSAKDCGDVMVYLATKRYPAKGAMSPGDEEKVIGGVAYSTQLELGGGAYAVGQRGDEPKHVSWAKVRKSDTKKKVWDHTRETLKAIEHKNKAT
ncbi:hypothetical protein BCR34DRAFT_605124 [Clohesyomyces aquaticus]|uniref:Uncharacterized protein n=1 Tax=Clohesyomyces aquaticus TaxID=1231657 RepID=A0A1Y1Z0D6_9PLEO|nr:hypothetical protein BCR34DRAFT_605124 [Clohesyomyces aquaticus]